jgi:hypothetical protein
MENNSIIFFEELVKTDQIESIRSARTIGMSSDTHKDLIIDKKPGVHLISGYGGGSYTCSWYLFRSENGKLYFIFRSIFENKTNWRFRETNDELNGVPLEIYE